MTGWIVRALALLAVVAALSPTVGAIVDHHSAERMPDHGHVYYGHPDLRHKHAYETPHVDMKSSVAAEPPRNTVVVILPSTSATRDGPLSDMALSIKTVDTQLVPVAPALFRIAYVEGARPRMVFLEPADPPPRAHA